ncbi:MAG: hypothetical protein IIY44_08650 [Erysipelotrichales bacterium]|nr:hypothetical protein [Erysipelotrichales bacterium]MBQ4375779.1 hypothetical protein [Erysipelotrichales bacterium]MBQ5542010.1 hypothetical protein [Erysipelotrichales bacterium]
MCFDWEDGFEIAVKNENGAVCIQANREGLVSLARLCIALAKETNGSHIHLDAYNSLEEGSDELILELKEEKRENGKKELP